ncbi:hypothetical protein [Candidatus Venteria ishoeyi]|uniref:DUF4124 domain-containing protein n=1 Tax=Candidatus Venteria ishoeyi TaxID=1899563 RepID=A0A1H6FEC2_9GAMM|nr:hypothetical protein [Candidatus Venteria ishoeyi]SEH08387.1 Uncharacterised protein [Candidatus Venteria ishoeyi]
MPSTKLKSSIFIGHLCILLLYTLAEVTTPTWAVYKCLTSEGDLIFSDVSCPNDAKSEVLYFSGTNTLHSKKHQEPASNPDNDEVAGLSGSISFNTSVKLKLKYPEKDKGKDNEDVMIYTSFSHQSDTLNSLLHRGRITVNLARKVANYHLEGRRILKKYPELQSDINKLHRDEKIVGIQYDCILTIKTSTLDGEPPWMFFKAGEKAPISFTYQSKPGEMRINFNHPVIDALVISTTIVIKRTITGGPSAVEALLAANKHAYYHLFTNRPNERTAERYLDKNNLPTLKTSDIEGICDNWVKFH